MYPQCREGCRVTMSAKTVQGPPFIYNLEEKTLGEFFFRRCQKYQDRICQVDGTHDVTETYASVKSRSVRVALYLQKKGVTSKDVITFCTFNTLDNTIPMIATSFLGAKITNLEASLSVRHTKHLLSLVEPKVIFVEEVALGLIEESLKGTKLTPEIIVFGKSDKYDTFSDLVKPQEQEEEFKPVDADPEDTAVILFSSGTSGLPKGICHSHRSVLSLLICCSNIGLCDATFHVSTFYWITALMLLGGSFIIGSYRVFCHNLSAEDVFRIIQKHKVASVFMAPTLTYQLSNVQDASKYDTSSLRLFMCGGTPMASSQMVKLSEVFKSALIVLGYGMSEIGLVASFGRDAHREFVKKKLTSCGTPAAGLQLKIVDPATEQQLGPNQKGEIRLKTPTLMKGYYKQDASEVFDQEGFLKSGDVGYYDCDGCVYVKGRIKEMFKYKSWHIIPSTIEDVLLEHPAVKEAVVFGVPSEEEDEVPAACLVLEEDRAVNEEELDGFLKNKVADRERLRGGVTFVEALPKTATGKIVRREVRDFVMNLAK